MTTGVNGQQYLTWEAIDAWARRSGEAPEPWEISVLETLDEVFMTPAPEPEADPANTAAIAKDTVRSLAPQGRRVVRRKPKTATPE